MKKLLVIGASGFVGGALARALCAEGHAVRCLARNPAKAQSLLAHGCEILQGDFSDLASLQVALKGIDAAYVSIQTISQQPGSSPDQGFMEIERTGLQNIVAACRDNGVRRLIYVTSVGIAPDSPSEWVRERWKIERDLLKSGLDVTIIGPGMIVGRGGRGFEMAVSQARQRVALVLGSGHARMSSIALDDLIYYLCGVRDEPRAYGSHFDVGNDDAPTTDQRIDVIADVMRRPHPWKIHIPAAILGLLAPLIERVAKSPRGAIKGIVDSLKADGIGDPLPIRAILPRPLLCFRAAVEAALNQQVQE